jgi:hypothetical protein
MLGGTSQTEDKKFFQRVGPANKLYFYRVCTLFALRYSLPCSRENVDTEISIAKPCWRLR